MATYVSFLDTTGATVAINPDAVTAVTPAPATIVPASVFVDVDGAPGRLLLPGTVAGVIAALATGISPASQGTYAPVFTPSAPTIAAFAASPWMWVRFGDTVIVHGSMGVSWPGYVAGTVPGTIVATLPFPPPINFNIGGAASAGAGGEATQAVGPYSSVTDAAFDFSTNDGQAQSVGVAFSYRVVFP